jgi:hypothetical protein
MKTFSILLTLGALVVQAGAQPVCSVPVPCGDFNAYQLKKAVSGSATVCTPFACADLVVQRTRRLVVPLDQMLPNTQHYLAYELRQENYPESANPSNLTFATQYGSTNQSLQNQTILLMVPAGKSIPPDPLPPLPASTAGFLCFKPSNTQFGKSNQTVTDQFGPQTYLIHKVAYACVSAGINAPAPAPTTWLLGIAAKDTTLKFLPDANVIDMFHPAGELIEVDPIDELLASATVTP